MCRKKIIILSIPLLACMIIIWLFQFMLPIKAYPTTICDVPSGTFTSIQSAVNDTTCTTVNLIGTYYTENVNIDRSLTIQGIDSEVTTIDGNNNGSVVTIDTGDPVTLTDFTVIYGSNSNGGGGIRSHGSHDVTIQGLEIISNTTSGIYSYYGSLDILSSTIAYNTGPGIHTGNSQLNLKNSNVINNQQGGITGNNIITITGSKISENQPGFDQYGCAINFGGGYLIISDSLLISNTAFIGGAIYNSPQGNVEIINSEIKGNSAQNDGGGIWNRGNLTITNSILSQNSAGSGGAIYSVSVLASVKIEGSTFTGNTAQSYGGGIANGTNAGGSGRLVIDKSLFWNNTSQYAGGGVFNNGTLTLTNSTFSGNEATETGGGIYVTSFRTKSITYSTFKDNSASYGGGLYTTDQLLNLGNSIIADSFSGGDCSGTPFVSDGYNLFSDTSCVITGTLDTTTITNTNPHLGSLQDNGGNTWTHAPMPNSPVINHIPSGINGCGTTIVTDQRGEPRPIGSGCDVGAFELQEPLSLFKSAPILTTGNDHITYTLLAANNLTSTLTGLIITDSIPIGANYVDGGTLIGDVVSFTIPSLMPSETISRQFVVTASETITNRQYRISSNEGYSSTGRIPIVTFIEVPVSDLLVLNDSPTPLSWITNLTATISAGTNVNYIWNFGDETFGTGEMVTHTYASPGIYTAVVTATNLAGSTVATTTIVVEAPVFDLIALNNSPTIIGQITNLTATISAGTNVSYFWDFGDESFGTGETVTHTYASPGIYTATVRAINLVSNVITTTTVIIEEPLCTIYLPIAIKP